MKNIVDSYNGPYNNNLLRVISPLLEAGLQHERDCLRLSSRRLWEETFALSACKLFVPPLLR